MIEKVSHFRLTLMEFSEIRLRSPSSHTIHPMPHIMHSFFFQLLDTRPRLCGPRAPSVTVAVNTKSSYNSAPCLHATSNTRPESQIIDIQTNK